MSQFQEVLFNSVTSACGSNLTACALEDNPEIILVMMGENVASDFISPPNLAKHFAVSISDREGDPDRESDEAIDVSIWFDSHADQDEVARIIQSFFEWKFPNFLMNENSFMEIQEPGKITVSLG